MDSPFFVHEGEFDKVDLPSYLGEHAKGHWIEIKHEMNAGDHDDLQNLLFKLSTPVDNRKSRAERRRAERIDTAQDISVKPSSLALLEINIHAWSFKDTTTGDNIPVSSTTIRGLKREVMEFVLDEIDIRNPTTGKPKTS